MKYAMRINVVEQVAKTVFDFVLGAFVWCLDFGYFADFALYVSA